jgi:hypothetical protein
MSNISNPAFDLEISHYTLQEIERFFNLKQDRQYKREDITEKKYRIREQLLESGHVPNRLKRDLIDFLDKAEKWIVEQRTIPTPPGTTLPKNVRLDNVDLPKSAEAMPRENEINVRPTTQFIYTNPSPFFPGIINPLDKRVITKMLAIDTKFRHNYAHTMSTDFQLQLPDRFTKVVSMQLTSIEIPKTYYNISASYRNNFFFMSVGVGANDYNANIFILPDGNYTAGTLMDAINAELVYMGGLFQYVYFSLDEMTKKVAVTTNNPTLSFVDLNFKSDIDGNDDGSPIYQKLGWVLGFTECRYEGCLNYLSDAPIQVDNISYFYLAIDDYNNNVNNGFISAFQDSILNANILARISGCNNEKESMIVKNDMNLITQPREYFGPVDIQKMQIRIYDSFGRILNLNNRDFSFCLIIKMLYDL